jgi:hypothetical protein
MSILNLNGPAGRSPRGKRAVKVWMGIGLVIAVLGVGSTLASTITINGGTNKEFGQGVQRTVYCGGNKQITVTPVSSYTNVQEPVPLDPEESAPEGDAQTANPTAQDLAGNFHLSGIKVTDVPRECSGVNFVFSVYDQKGTQTPIAVSTRGDLPITTPTVYWYDNPEVNVEGFVADARGNPTSVTKSADYFGVLSYDRDKFQPADDQMTLSVFKRDRDKGAFTITFVGGDFPNINDVGRVVVETQNDAIFKTLGPVLFPPLITTLIP